MLRFRFRTLNTADVDADVLACWELSAFFRGLAAVDDLEMDKERAAEWYIDKFVEESARDDYRAEPQMAEDEMLESYSTSLRKLARERADLLGERYPLILDESGHLYPKESAELSSISISYLALQFFRAFKRGLIEIDGPDDGSVKQTKQRFESHFRRLFEYIAGYAVAGRKTGVPLMTSESRGSRRLNALLNGMCRKVGAGKVKPYSDWNEIQKTANDGGVDSLIHVGGPGMPGDAYLVLVGATVQETDVKNKIIGGDQRAHFSSFFSTKPAPFQSVLVRPQDEDPLTKLRCADQDCMLYSYEEVCKGLAACSGQGVATSAIKRLDARVWRLFDEFREAIFLDGYEEYKCESI